MLIQKEIIIIKRIIKIMINMGDIKAIRDMTIIIKKIKVIIIKNKNK